MDEIKPFWQSKTFWINIFAAVGLVVNAQMDGYNLGPEAQAGIIAFINIALRFVTKNEISLT